MHCTLELTARVMHILFFSSHFPLPLQISIFLLTYTVLFWSIAWLGFDTTQPTCSTSPLIVIFFLPFCSFFFFLDVCVCAWVFILTTKEKPLNSPLAVSSSFSNICIKEILRPREIGYDKQEPLIAVKPSRPPTNVG